VRNKKVAITFLFCGGNKLPNILSILPNFLKKEFLNLFKNDLNVLIRF